MLRFTLFGFSVFIHWGFWLNTALMGGALGADSPAAMRHLLAWMVAVFLSILIHELGHALTMRNFGDRRVGIILYAFGGLAQGEGLRTRREDFMVSAAGPALQMLVGLAVGWASVLWPVSSPVFASLLDAFISVSILWALLNLLPIIPLDGGRLCLAVLGAGGQWRALIISLVCCIGVALLMLDEYLWLQFQNRIMRTLDLHARTRVGGGLFSLLIFGMLAWNNWKQLRNEPQIPWMNAR